MFFRVDPDFVGTNYLKSIMGNLRLLDQIIFINVIFKEKGVDYKSNLENISEYYVVINAGNGKTPLIILLNIRMNLNMQRYIIRCKKFVFTIDML